MKKHKKGIVGCQMTTTHLKDKSPPAAQNKLDYLMHLGYTGRMNLTSDQALDLTIKQVSKKIKELYNR